MAKPRLLLAGLLALTALTPAIAGQNAQWLLRGEQPQTNWSLRGQAPKANWSLRGEPPRGYDRMMGGALRPAVALEESVKRYPLLSENLRLKRHDEFANVPGLRGAIASAVFLDPMFMAAQMEVEAANRGIWAQLLKFAPTATTTIQATRYSPEAEFTHFHGVDGETYGTISASLTLFDGGQRYYGVKSARSRRDAAIYDALATRDRTALQLIEAWTQSIAGDRDRELSLAAVSRLSRLRQAVAAQQRAGFASAADISEVDASIASARRSIESIQASTERSRLTAMRLSGRTPPTSGDLPRFAAYMRGDKLEFIQSAHEKNPQLQAAASRYSSSVYDSRSAFGRMLPQLSVNGNYRATMDRYARSTASDGWSVNVKLTVPLLDLSTMADSAAQEKRTDAALYREAAALREVESQIDNLWTEWEATGAMMSEAKKEASARRQTADAARDRFAKGFGTLDEAVRAETALLSARRSVLQLEAQESLLAAQLLIVSGLFDAGMLRN